MNWRVGLFRLWLIAAALWTAYWLFQLDPICFYRSESWCRDVVWEATASDLLRFAGVIVGGRLLALILGSAVLWAVGGFRAMR